MRLLLDTHFVYWWLSGSAKLGKQTRTTIETNDCAACTVSLIESRIKAMTGRLTVPEPRVVEQHLSDDGIAMIALSAAHIAESVRFEHAHPDLYDRLLLGCAAAENRILITRDAALLALAKKAKLAFVAKG